MAGRHGALDQFSTWDACGPSGEISQNHRLAQSISLCTAKYFHIHAEGAEASEARLITDGQGSHPPHVARCINLKVIEGTWRLKIPKKSICKHLRPLESPACILADGESKSASRSCGASLQFTFILLIFVQHADITLKDVPDRQYTLRLFVENVESALRRNDNHTWTPEQRQYVPYFANTYTQQCMCVYRDVSLTSKIRVEFRKKTDIQFWQRIRRRAKPSTFKDSPMITVTLKSTTSSYWVSRYHHPSTHIA
jgi:hypothetical protein